MNLIACIILFFLLAEYVLNLAADNLNLASVSEHVPPSFEDVYDPVKYKQSQSYLRVNTRFEQVVNSIDLLVLLVFWFCGGFAVIDRWTRSFGWGMVATGIIYILALAGLKTMLDQLPALYHTFVIEERFGFNKTTLGTWVKDRIKGLVLALVLGVPLLAGVLAFFNHAGAYAWLWCWGLVTLFSLIVQFVAPTWIMPLFNKFEPLEEGKLKDAIMAYARSIGFSLDNIFVMDGSKRSSKSNAFFTGFGRHRRIVLFDTLIEKHTAEELVAVLAHEMGHYRLRHIIKTMVIGICQAGVLFYLMSLFIDTPALFEAFFMERPSIHAGLIFFSMLYAPIDFFLGLIVQKLSRVHEYEADRFSVTTTGHRQPMIDALKKLSVHNLSNLTPHPFYVFLNYSHPPMLQRIEAIEKTIV